MHLATGTLLGLVLAALAVDASTEYKSLYGENVQTLPQILKNVGQLPEILRTFIEENRRNQRSEVPDVTPSKKTKYDFVVVGAGSAGAALASRLSETSTTKVLLLEAGDGEQFVADIPLAANILQLGDRINWGYETESSENYCRGMIGNRCRWPRGRVMGGSSVLNYMIASRGHPKDYDDWAKMGNVGWSYEEVLPYFKRLETMRIDELKDDTKQHGTNGPVHVTYPPFRTPVSESFVKAGVELGYPQTRDYNDNRTMGFSFLQTTTTNGIRMSSNRAYLYPAKGRKNLHVSKGSLVKRIIFDRDRKRAIGVEFRKSDQDYRVYARKEVILCAGTIGSAQLLMLSGIGHADHLRNMSIDVIRDLPVGDNLMDHISYGGLAFLIDQPVSIIFLDVVNPVNPYLADFMLRRKGPLTIAGGTEAVGFIDVDRPNNATGPPNIELLFVSGSLCAGGGLEMSFGLSKAGYEGVCGGIKHHHAWTVFPILLKPKSRGRIRLRSDSIDDNPKIVANYMSHPDDVRIMVKGIRAAINVSRTDAMKEFGTTLHKAELPGCEKYRYDSDEYWECAARTITANIYHYAGTCRMGPEKDKQSVVNPKLQVIGVTGLRVADASIFPSMPSGHTNLPVYMVAEKLADMLRKEWKLS